MNIETILTEHLDELTSNFNSSTPANWSANVVTTPDDMPFVHISHNDVVVKRCTTDLHYNTDFIKGTLAGIRLTLET